MLLLPLSIVMFHITAQKGCKTDKIIVTNRCCKPFLYVAMHKLDLTSSIFSELLNVMGSYIYNQLSEFAFRFGKKKIKIKMDVGVGAMIADTSHFPNTIS